MYLYIEETSVFVVQKLTRPQSPLKRNLDAYPTRLTIFSQETTGDESGPKMATKLYLQTPCQRSSVHVISGISEKSLYRGSLYCSVFVLTKWRYHKGDTNRG
ncbi:hypothetical protein OS493_034038 [Desmophyllum pertusum]|uniref:Uncharacterized protein n=1 Tax=Desmophyllum pertusum TaxID=174260 RepID=A0A9X0CQT8_9CNID|nr:hypothetical protein OS493_034038 [Desmophyllum pertusum]